MEFSGLVNIQNHLTYKHPSCPQYKEHTHKKNNSSTSMYRLSKGVHFELDNLMPTESEWNRYGLV